MTQPPDDPVVIDLITRQPRAPKDTPFKRKRKHRKEAPRTAAGDLAVFLADWEPLHGVASCLEQWHPGDRGRPPDLLPAAHLLFGIMCLHCRNSDRQAEAELRAHTPWEVVRTALAKRHPHYPGLRPGAQSISRREFWRFREKHGITDDILEDLREQLRTTTAILARGFGNCDPTKGSFTPALENILVGDGTVLTSHYKGKPSDRQLNRDTGELEPVKYDPDADYYETGGGEERCYGLKFGFIQTWTPYESERLVHDVFSVRNAPGRDEAAEAVRSITAVLDHLPGTQGVSWDKALRGIHFDQTRRLGLVDVVKVGKTAAGAGKKIPPPRDSHGKRRTGHLFTLQDGTQQELALYTFDGHPHIEVIVQGKKARLPLRRCRTRRVGQRGDGYRFYNDYRVPHEPTVPQPLRDATVTVRLDRCEDDGNYNRAEHLRPITIHDPPVAPHADPEHESEFDQRYVLRPGAESVNRWTKEHFHDKRAPAVGIGRNHFMLICAALLNNARAVLAQQARLRQAA